MFPHGEEFIPLRDEYRKISMEKRVYDNGMPYFAKDYDILPSVNVYLQILERFSMDIRRISIDMFNICRYLLTFNASQKKPGNWNRKIFEIERIM